MKDESIAEQSIEFFDEELSSVGINLSHAFDMAEEKSFINETSKRGLINGGRVLVHRAADFGHRIAQLLRPNDIAQSQ